MSGLVVVVRSLFGAVRPVQLFAFGGRILPKEAPELWRCVTETAARLGALPPDEIVAGLDVNFFVTQAEVVTPNGPCRGRTLFCSLPLARILTVAEFTAIVGHELGHFRGEDTAMSQQFYPIYRGTTAAIDGLAASGGGARGLALLPAAAILGFFLDRFASAERHHSRARELLADRAGVEATSVRAMAAALVKTHAYADLWPAVFEQLAEMPPHEHRPEHSGSMLFASAAVRGATPRRLEDVAGTSTGHPTDTHPALDVRLDALGVGLAGVSNDALQVAPTPPAISLVPTAELHEQALGTIIAMSRARRRPPAKHEPAPGRLDRAGRRPAAALDSRRDDHGAMFEPVLDAFAASHRVIVPNLRGHGRSRHLPPPYTAARLAQDLADLLDHLGVASTDVVGYSQGRAIAQQFALDHATRCRRLVLACTYAYNMATVRERIEGRAAPLPDPRARHAAVRTAR